MGALKRVSALRTQTLKRNAIKPSPLSGKDGSLGPTIERWTLSLVLFAFGVVGAIGQWFPSDSVSIVMGQTMPQIALWLVLAVATAVFSFLAPKRSTAWSITSNVVGVSLLLWIAFSTWMVQGRGNLRFAVNMFWQWIAVGLVFAMSFWIARRIKQRSPLVVFFLALSIATSFHAVYQYAYSMPRDRQRYKEEPEVVLRELGLDAQAGSATRLRWEDRLQSTEPIGPYALTNSLAGFLAPCVILFGAMLVETRNLRKWHWRRIGIVAAFALSLVVLGLTKSRTAWLASLSAAFLYGALHPVSRAHIQRNFYRWLIGAASVLVVAAIWVLAVDSRIMTEAPKSFAFRWQYWQSTLVLIWHNLLFGVGPGNFQDYYATYKLPNSSETVLDPHSFLLETIATGGVLAGILLLAWLSCIFVGWWRQYGLEQDESKSVEGSNSGSFSALGIGVVVAGFIWLIVPQFLGVGPDPYPYVIGVPLALLWIRAIGGGLGQFDISSRAVVCALVAGVVNLSASGGWLSPGITNILAVLAGILVAGNSVSKNNTNGGGERGERLLKYAWSVRLLLVVVCVLLVFAFLKTAWEPIQRASAIGTKPVVSLEQAERNAREAAAIDPWNPAYRAALVGLSFMEIFQRVREGRLEGSSLKNCEKSVEDLLLADPHSWRANFEIGRQSLGLSRDVPKMAEMARLHFLQAAKLSPQDASCQLQAALACWLTGEDAVAKEKLEIAAEIDQETPHRDQKLVSLLIWWPDNVGPRSQLKNGVEWKSIGRDSALSPGWVRAEPVANLLRNELD
jgi:O-Antigen ligase